MSVDDVVHVVQRVFPQVYFACHVEHAPPGADERGLAPRFNRLLSHLSVDRGLAMGPLAKHLNVAPSSASEMVERLERLGLVRRARGEGDARRVEVRLTPAGLAARSTTSVLDTARLTALLQRLSRAERADVERGFLAIARACHEGVS